MSDPKPLTEEQTARLKEQAWEMVLWQQLVEFAQQGLIEASWRFQHSDVTKEETPSNTRTAIPKSATYVLRDADGKVFSADQQGKVLYRNPADITVRGPFQVYVTNDSGVLFSFTEWTEQTFS